MRNVRIILETVELNDPDFRKDLKDLNIEMELVGVSINNYALIAYTGERRALQELVDDWWGGINSEFAYL